jgi:hypothetical protein
MKSKSINKIGAHVPKAFAPADMYTSIEEEFEPSPFTEYDDEMSSTGTLSLSEDDLPPPLVIPYKKKKIQVISILQEETDYR